MFFSFSLPLAYPIHLSKMPSNIVDFGAMCTDAASALSKATQAVEDSNWAESADSYASAVKTLEEALLRALCNRANSLVQLDRFVECIEVSERAISLAKNEAEPHYWCALGNEKMMAFSTAAKYYRTASKLEKDLAVRMSYNEGSQRCSIKAADAKAQLSKKKETDTASLEKARAEAEISRVARAKANSAPLAPAAAGSAQAGNVKIDWYQSGTVVSLDVFAKGADKEKSTVTIGEKRLEMKLSVPGKEPFVFDKVLFSEVDPSRSSWTVTKYKVEVRLRKKEEIKWVALDGAGDVASAAVAASAIAQRRMAAANEKQKNWNSKIEEELKDYKEDDSAMSVFRDMYKGVDDDTRRAMVKSYSESGGQVLSTDWGKVKKEKVVYKPVSERNKDDD